MGADLPIIGISGNVSVEKNGRFPGYRSVFAYEDYVTAIEDVNGAALILPVTTNSAVIERHAAHIDGLLLTGGSDINPLFYQEEPLEKLQQLSSERDRFEMALVRAVINAGKPVFGICRGIHILNVAYGGTLYQDLTYYPNVSVKHKQQSGPYEVSHTVHVQQGSYLYDVLGEKVWTNSFHHQAVKEVAAEFVVSATSDDGVIEAIEMRDKSFVLGVQWHPERMVNHHGNMRKLFADFVECAKES